MSIDEFLFFHTLVVDLLCVASLIVPIVVLWPWHDGIVRKTLLAVGSIALSWIAATVTVSLVVFFALRLDEPLAQLMLNQPKYSFLYPLRQITTTVQSYWWISFPIAVPATAVALAIPLSSRLKRHFSRRKAGQNGAA